MALNREQIRQKLEIRPVEVEVEKLGGSILVRELTIPERRDFLRFIRETDAGEDADAADEVVSRLDHAIWLVTHCVVDEAANPLFSNGDKEWLREKASSLGLVDMAEAVLEVNGFDDAAVEEAQGN